MEVREAIEFFNRLAEITSSLHVSGGYDIMSACRDARAEQRTYVVLLSGGLAGVIFWAGAEPTAAPYRTGFLFTPPGVIVPDPNSGD